MHRFSANAALLTPAVVHSQRAEQVRNLCQHTLDIAYAAHLESLFWRLSSPLHRGEVWINWFSIPHGLANSDKQTRYAYTLPAGVSWPLTGKRSCE